MPFIPYALTRSFLFGLDPELAHELTLGGLARIQRTPLICAVAQAAVHDPVTVDKNGCCIDGLGAMGFGFIEVGTVTPKAQDGNPKPRMFRLPQANALINRLGFNNEGLESFLRNVQRAEFRQKGGILGLNIGKNATTSIEQAASDYLTCLNGVYPHADYVAVNISSPNTQNLRALQSDAALDALLGALQARRSELAQQHGKRVPLFVKIAPDLEEAQVHVIAQTLMNNGMDGVIATNTTTARDQVAHLSYGHEAGGLSGAPVFQASNRVIAQLRATLGPQMPIIGVGGVMSGRDAAAKRQAGADLVQIYTGLIYKGPGLVKEAAQALQAT
jgi:dihydroorotate dehydrogenase